MPNKQHPITWVLVANKCQAKIYHLAKFPKVEEISHFEHPESGQHNQDLVSTRPGAGSQRGGNVRYSYERETEPKHLEAVKFATQLADILAVAERKGEFHRLYIFAEPSFLGLLRQHISQETKKNIVAEIAKDLASFETAAIEQHLSEI